MKTILDGSKKKSENQLKEESYERVLETIFDMYFKEIIVEEMYTKLELQIENNNNNNDIKSNYEIENNVLNNTPIRRGKAITNYELVLLLDCYRINIINDKQNNQRFVWKNVMEMSRNKGLDRSVLSVKKLINKLIIEFLNAINQHSKSSKYSFKQFVEESTENEDNNDLYTSYAGEIMTVIINNEKVKMCYHPKVRTLDVYIKLLFIMILLYQS